MSNAAASLLNPGQLKLDLVLNGVRLDAETRTEPSLQALTDLAGPLMRGIELVLPNDVWVSVSVDERVADYSPYVLSKDHDQYRLHRNGDDIAVRLVPTPAFYRLTTSAGRPMWQVGMAYGGFIAINPTWACGYSVRGMPCRFCRSGSGIAIQDGFPMSVQEVVEVVRTAFAEGVVEFVYFNPAYIGGDDAGIAFLEPYIKAVKKHFDTLIAVQIHPPKTDRWIDRTYAMGVDAISYPVEIHDYDALAQRCPGRVRHIGRERYYEALAYAASIFPSGTVWSDLVLGMEPIDSTMQGIDTLVQTGVLPVLSVAPPTDGGGTSAASLPGLDALHALFAHLFHAVRKARINMGWVRDLSFAITPLEARFFAGDDARLTVAMQHFYRSRLGTLTTRGLSRLRRRLRVRTVSDSFDSSRL